MTTPNSVFEFNDRFEVTEEVQRAFDVNGYILVKGLLNESEMGKLHEALSVEGGVLEHRYQVDDGEGRMTKMVLWNHPGSDLTGILARSEKLAGTFEKLLGGEVYHYHSKLILKEAKTGGSHCWHQDYGYWYENGCMFPNMGTVWIAVDKATKQNGCLKILKGSHLMGRINHVAIAEHIGADIRRVEEAHKFCELVFVEVEPGDALFFHCNLLHRSDPNNSEDMRRWAFLVAYNRKDNNPVKKHYHPFYTPLEKVPDSAILQCTNFADMSGKDFYAGPKDKHYQELLQTCQESMSTS